MFEEYITNTWICPQCGEINKIRVEETNEVIYKKGNLGIFEYIRGKQSMKVYCSECNSDCYRV